MARGRGGEQDAEVPLEKKNTGAQGLQRHRGKEGRQGRASGAGIPTEVARHEGDIEHYRQDAGVHRHEHVRSPTRIAPHYALKCRQDGGATKQSDAAS